MPINKYLHRAMKLKDEPVASSVAKGANSVINYGDRLLGISASRMKHEAAGAAKVVDPSNRYLRVLQGRADEAQAASHKTRVRTGMAIGGGLLANHMLSSYNPPSPGYQYTYPDSGMPY